MTRGRNFHLDNHEYLQIILISKYVLSFEVKWFLINLHNVATSFDYSSVDSCHRWHVIHEKENNEVEHTRQNKFGVFTELSCSWAAVDEATVPRGVLIGPIRWSNTQRYPIRLRPTDSRLDTESTISLTTIYQRTRGVSMVKYSRGFGTEPEEWLTMELSSTESVSRRLVTRFLRAITIRWSRKLSSSIYK